MFSHCLWQSLPGPAVLPRPLPDPRCSSHTGQAVLFITWALHSLLSGTRGLIHALPNFKDEESVSCKGVSINSTSPEGFLGAENATFPRGGWGGEAGGVGERMALGETEATVSPGMLGPKDLENQPSHPLSSPSPPAPNPSQHESFPNTQYGVVSNRHQSVRHILRIYLFLSYNWRIIAL